MPNLDGGHYFFTAVVPICNEGIVEHEGMKSSPVHMVREALETLPTALQSRAAEKIGIQSPFARSDRTHFARLIVLDQPFYNGRDHSDAVWNAVRGLWSPVDLLKAQPHDQLSCPYLLVIFDFDPVSPDGRGDPRDYLEHLWGVMKDELIEIFRYCYGFPSVRDAPGFADFLLACQIETTMPFNDYWVEPPKLPNRAALLAVAPALGLLIGIFGCWPLHWWTWQAAIPISLVLLVVGLLIDIPLILKLGAKPFPSSHAPLRQVLKALYLQQAFARFAIEQQGADQAAAGAAFKAFLDQHRPSDLLQPTQPPGVVRTDFEGAQA